MHAKQYFYCALLIAITHTVGCQSWQGMGLPIQNATRVPPPGTGTYQLPTGYYNNNSTSSLAPTGQTMQASNSAAGALQGAASTLRDAASTLRTASGPLPTTNMTANNSLGNFATSSSSSTYPTSNISTGLANAAPSTSFGPQASMPGSFQPANTLGSGVVPAAFQSEASNQSAGATANFSNSNSGSGATTNFSDAPNTEAPSLQWQQFGGQ